MHFNFFFSSHLRKTTSPSTTQPKERNMINKTQNRIKFHLHKLKLNCKSFIWKWLFKTSFIVYILIPMLPNHCAVHSLLHQRFFFNKNKKTNSTNYYFFYLPHKLLQKGCNLLKLHHCSKICDFIFNLTEKLV